MERVEARLAGAHEVRELLGVSRQRVYQLASRSDFPEPVATLAQGKIWAIGDIERWAAEHRWSRKKAVRERAAASQGRAAAGREHAETVREQAEAGREHPEVSREQPETAREQAEAGRERAETVRVQRQTVQEQTEAARERAGDPAPDLVGAAG